MVEEYLERAQHDHSILSRSFWFGKYLQGLPEAVEPGTDVEGQIREAVQCVATPQTSLSPNVHRIILGSLQTRDVAAPDLLCADGTLNLSVVAGYLQEETKLADFNSMVAKCGSIAKQVCSQLLSSRDTLGQLCKEVHYQWTRSPQVFMTCLVDLQGESRLRCHTTLLIGCAVLEAALGDVYLSVSKAQHCPFLMRDLLNTSELQTTFGVTLMLLLQCLMGPPSGLNLRNVLWHGFAAASEIPHEYDYFFFVIVATLGKVLEASLLPITHRPYTSCPQSLVLESVFDVVHQCEFPVVDELFSSSFLILPTMLPTWRAAVAALQNKRFDCFLVLMLSSLEHALRRVYTCVNACPERAITAESENMYTTFDEILSPLLPTGAVNRLKEDLHHPQLEMLLDLLAHPEGPRLRDRVSHGQTNYEDISETLANHVLCIAIVLAAHYSLDKQILARSPVSACVGVGQRYVSLFHPLSLLRRELLQLIAHADQLTGSTAVEQVSWASIKAATLHIVGCLQQTAVLPCTTEELELAVCGSANNVLAELVGQVWAVDTLYADRLQLELTCVLRNVVSWTTKSAVQIRETQMLRSEQLKQKQLRSRQRTNYQHLLASVGLYKHVLHLMAVLVVTIIHNVKSTSKRMIKFTKKVLQFSENFYSQTLPSKNRWQEANILCNALAEMLSVFTCPLVFVSCSDNFDSQALG